MLARLPSGGLARGVFAVHGRPDAPTYGFLQTAEHAAAASARVDGRLVVYGHTHQPAWWEPTADGRVVHRRVPTGTAVEVAAGPNPGAAWDPAGVRWLALEFREAGAPFAATFLLEAAPR